MRWIGTTLLAMAIAISSEAQAQTDQQRQFIEQHPARQVFLNNCARCHGAGLGGMIGPSFLDDEWRYEPGVEGVEKSIRSGHGRLGMPSFSKTLTDEQIASLAHYLANAHKPDPVLPGEGDNATAEPDPAATTAGDELTHYLLVYFTDPTHALHFALSDDGYTFTALNNGAPVMTFEDIADQKGIRDPHIARAPDGTFVLAMTDLHIFGQQEGHRDTQWDRPGDAWGWGNNRGFVVSTSDDLVNWTHHNIRIDELGPRYREVGCAWAPELTWDDQRDRMMIHFTIRYNNDPNRLVYAYLNDDYSALETAPKLLFHYPKDVNTIDSDITRFKDKYYLLFTPHDGGAGVKMAVSDRLTGGYVYQDRWIDPEPEACEGPSVWRRLGSDTYVLMYDVFGKQPHNFGFCETTDFETFTPIGSFNDGPMKATNFTSPKHGAVIHLTAREAERLRKAFPSD